MIPFVDLKPSHEEINVPLLAAYQKVLAQSNFIMGPELESFEKEFAHYSKAKHCLGLGNGLDAISLSLMALNIGPGDQVIVPSHTFVATWLGVSNTGAEVIPVEVDPSTYNLDPKKIEAAITPKTKAIMPVHLYGQPADMEAISAIAKKRSLFLVEDAAQAHGATFNGQPVGHFADVTSYSFYPGKNLGALGDGGAITTNNEDLFKKIAKLRNYGSLVKYQHDVKGVNSRLDELQAAILRIKLTRLDQWNKQRNERAQFYLQNLKDVKQIVLPKVDSRAHHVWHLYAIQAENRDGLKKHLDELGITTLIHYPTPPHKCGAYKSHSELRFELTENICSRILSLPFWPQITADQQTTVVNAIKDFYKN